MTETIPGSTLRSGLAVRTALVLLLTVVRLFAGDNPKSATAVRTAVPPRIDGRLDEAVWQSATPAGDFVQYDPVEGSPPTQRTEVRFLYDDEALYIGATMFDTDPAGIVARLARRDDEIESDYISFRFDTYHDHQTAYEFTVNPAGVKIDILQYDDGVHEDVSWDAVWEVETSTTGDRWVAELRIPFSMLRFQNIDVQEWGLQIVRRISRNQERLYWARIPKSESGWVSKFGHLEGIKGIVHHAGLEVLPYGLMSSSALADRPGFAEQHRTTLNSGLDLKYRPSAGITVDATFNPDFGQVEADPAVLNLTTFETFYPEKRPFFIEGVQILKFTSFGDEAGPGMFYSRRIGRSLSAEAPDGGYVEEEPRFASILGAVKVSGKTSSGLSVGVLEAVTAPEQATVVDSDGVRTRPLIEPTTNYSLARLKQDFGGNSNVGMILTSVNRKDRIPAFTGGFDWNVRLFDNMYRLDGFYGHSRTSLRGFTEEGAAGRITLAKNGGPHWRGNITTDFTSRHYNINDIGFFRRPNDHGIMETILYRDDTVDEWKRFWSVSLFHHSRWNFEGAELIESWNPSLALHLANYWEIQVTGAFDSGRYDDRETRGHGLYHKPGSSQVQVSVETDQRGMLSAELSVQVNRDTKNRRGWQSGLELNYKPTSALTIDAEVEYARTDRHFAWADNVTDGSITAGEFAVFADRSTRTVDATLRGSYVFTPTLTIQWYAQWFAAQGTYSDPKARLDVDSYVLYPAFTKSDFTDLAFNSNVVLRWEYRPGSTLYLVWSHARNGAGGMFTRTLQDNLGDTFHVPPDNVLMLKISYWLST